MVLLTRIIKSGKIDNLCRISLLCQCSKDGFPLVSQLVINSLLIILISYQGTIWCLNSVEWRLIFEALLGCKVVQGFLSLIWSSERAVLSILLVQGAEDCVLVINAGSSCRSWPISHESAIVVGSALFLTSGIQVIVLIDIVIKAKIYKFLQGCVIGSLEVCAIFTVIAFIHIGSGDQCGALEIESLVLLVRCLSRRKCIVIIFVGRSILPPLYQILNIYVVHISSLIGIFENSLSYL